MPTLIIILVAVVVLFLVYKVLVSRRRASGVGDPAIHFCIPLTNPMHLDCARLMQGFQEQWGIRVGCDENPEWSNPTQQTRKYLLTDGRNGLLITTSGRPLPASLRTITAEAAPDLSQEQKDALMNHEGFVMLEYAMGQDGPVEGVRFALKVLLVMLKMLPATGYISIGGQTYQPIEKVEPLFDDDLDLPAVFLLAVGVQVVDEDGYAWMHTHGMDQFGLPDLEIKFADCDQAGYYHELIGNGAIYMMNQGPILKPGHTCELAGDGVVYRILAPRGESKTHFGRYGALEIAPKVLAK